MKAQGGSKQTDLPVVSMRGLQFQPLKLRCVVMSREALEEVVEASEYSEFSTPLIDSVT